MIKPAKILVKNLMPPIVTKIYSYMTTRYGLFGDYPDWKAAERESLGYDADVIFNKVKESSLKVKNKEAVYERDSVLFSEIQYSWPLLATLLWIASKNRNKLNLIDFGGSLGSSYFQNRFFLEHLNELGWNVIEQQKFVEYGKLYFENEHLKFYYNLEECIKEQTPDVIFFSGLIQHVADPYALLEKVINKGFKYIIFDRTPFFEKEKDRIFIQKVDPKIFNASYPIRIFNREKFLRRFHGKYRLIAEFDVPEKVNISCVFKGIIFMLSGGV